MLPPVVQRWFEHRASRRQMFEEKEFFEAWDAMGEWDGDPVTGERYEPTWDPSTGEWVYRDRRVKGVPRARE